MRKFLCVALGVVTSAFVCKAESISFPQGYVPFSSIFYESQPDQNGNMLVEGWTANGNGLGWVQLYNYLSSLPAVSGDQAYANQPIELAPGMFFSNVLVPTVAERAGDFQDFGGPVMDPMTGGPNGQDMVAFPGNQIPPSRLFGFFAFRVGAAVSPVPEPNGFFLLALGAGALSLKIKRTLRASSALPPK